MTMQTTIEVRKTALGDTRSVATDAPALNEGEARLRVERFAITANNVTYGVVGERIGYWKFFPASGEGWGVIPVWGVAVVEESAASGLSVGERLYGYLPMASHLTISPAKLRPESLFDGAAHRAALPPVYNRYLRLSADPAYDPSQDETRMILWPLYATSFCLCDFFIANDWFGAERVIIPSASSKTAIGTAYAIAGEQPDKHLVGVTSARNADAVRALGLYDEVVLYDDIEKEIDAAAPSVIIDMSGSGEILGRLHRHLGDDMRYTSNVGVTHYDEAGMGPDFIRERSAMFFAPGHIQKRNEEWGPGVFEAKSMAFFAEAAEKSRGWLQVRRAEGAGAAQGAWAEVLAGETPPEAAWVAAI